MVAAILPDLGRLIALAASTALAVWVIGSIVLRLFGISLVIVGLAGAAFGRPTGLLVADVGSLLWALGHWLYAVRHHTYKSPLARRLFLWLLPERADPTRHWT